VPRVLRWRCNIDEFVDKTFEMVGVWKPKKVCIEQRAAQILFVKIFRDQWKMGKQPFVLDDWVGGNATKPSRIKGLIPYYANGLIFHRDAENAANAKHIEELEQELIDFPTPEHDDASDALSAAVQKVYAPGRDAPDIATEKRNLTFEAAIASLDSASRRAARAWQNRNSKTTDEWLAEG
jgi:predicted phage terminase large subunit-like protein